MTAALAIVLLGCSAHRTAAPRPLPQGDKFWNGCEPVVPANEDGFQHFVCTDVEHKEWEVLLRRGEKK